MTLRAQLAFAAKEVPQLLLSAKLPPDTGTMWIAAILRLVLPIFVTFTTWGRLVVPRGWPPKLKLTGESFTTVPTPNS